MNFFLCSFFRIYLYFFKIISSKNILQLLQLWGLGIGDWGLGIGDWGLGPIPNPQKNLI
jgi:hypothetical protein